MKTRRVVEKLDKAGAILIGKLAMVELGGRRRLPLRRGFADRAGPESVGSHAMERRIVERLGRRDGGGPGDVRARIGNVRLDPHAQRLLRRHRTAADLRTGQPARRDGAFLDAG